MFVLTLIFLIAALTGNIMQAICNAIAKKKRDQLFAQYYEKWNAQNIKSMEVE